MNIESTSTISFSHGSMTMSNIIDETRTSRKFIQSREGDKLTRISENNLECR